MVDHPMTPVPAVPTETTCPRQGRDSTHKQERPAHPATGQPDAPNRNGAYRMTRVTKRFAAGAAAVVAAATFAAGAQDAAAAGGCATRISYLLVRDGQTPATVTAELHERGRVLGRGPYLESRRYRTCDGTHVIYVNYKRRTLSNPRRAYLELWGY